MAKQCRMKTILKRELVTEKVIDSYDNILNYNGFIKATNELNKDLHEKYNVKGKIVSVDSTDSRRAVFDTDTLNDIDVIRGINYGNDKFVPYQETFIGSMLKSYESKNLAVEPLEVGNIVSHKNDVFIFLGYTESGLKLYTPHPLEGDKTKYVSADEIEAFTETADLVTSNKQKYIVFPDNTVMDSEERIHKGNMRQNKVLEMRTYLRNLEVGIEDVALQLYDNSYKTLSYEDFVREISQINKLMKYNYGLSEIKDAIKCY